MKSKNNIFDSLQAHWAKDLLSGFLVSLIALPLCLGIAGASNFPPIMGVMTAIVGGIVVAFFAGSELTIKGPAAGLIVIVAGAVEELGKGDNEVGWKLALGVVVVAGLIQIVLGLLKVAKLADFFPLSAVHGMLAAIGIIIMSKQLHLAVGIAPSEMKGKEPLELLEMVPHSLMHMEYHIAIIGGISLLILFGWPYLQIKALKKVPPALVVLIVGVLLGQYFHLTEPSYKNLKPLVNPGDFSINLNADFSVLTNSELLPIFLKYLLMFVLIGSLESLLTGRAIDLIDPEKRKSDLSRDLTAVGIGNTISGLLGGLPMISEVARSSANINNGAKSRWANFFHGIFLLLFVVMLVPVIKMVPVASLAAMLIFVGFRLASPKEFAHVYHIGKEQLTIFLITIIATIATDLLVGIAAGILTKFIIQLAFGVQIKDIIKSRFELTEQELGVYHLSVKNAAVFANYLKLKAQLAKVPQGSSLIIDFSKAAYVDHTVADNLNNFRREFEAAGGVLSLKGLDLHESLSEHPLAARRLPKHLRKTLVEMA
ncbi:MFS superfamily sulfate permease-like transporter [Runella defluvii]|uniref:MFS superfamily sulfate permease-like transporter n=1 Tax=Runella defluvii TaxID=370973 RepID=A0A7W5ZHA7_9BACT|nr:SulP family inorganic anion transporter [Runella defluvii]MBB3837140.1 MFS superfamily sulfate permease-like transporter [Runella defluvii]